LLFIEENKSLDELNGCAFIALVKIIAETVKPPK